MILIDSLYINAGGGLVLLEYLVEELQKQKKEFFLLTDERCGSQFRRLPHQQSLKATMRGRIRFYQQHSREFSAVLCFGNIPAPIKLEVPVYTYFHNISLLTLQGFSPKTYWKAWLKRQVFRCLKGNTNYWLVQTQNTAYQLEQHLKEPQEKISLFPFFKIPESLYKCANQQTRQDYALIGAYYGGAKGHDALLEAWKILHKKGIDRTLHLTIGPTDTAFLGKLQKAKEEGVQIINHGCIPFDDVVSIYGKCKALVYPSHDESLGLGLIEAATAGCDIIASDLPFTHAVCSPTAVFNPYDANDIARAIEDYEQNPLPHSTLKIKNKINELIKLIYSND